MGADLKTITTFPRSKVVLEEDNLVLLEPSSYREDRVRRILFDRIESIVVWKSVAIAQIVWIAVLFFLPGTLLMFVDHVVAAGFTIGLYVVGLMLLIPVLTWRRTTIRITRKGKIRDLKAVARPGKLARFLKRLCDNVRRAQWEKAQRFEQRYARQPEGGTQDLDEDKSEATPIPLEERDERSDQALE